MRVLYLTYDGLLDPLGQSQVIPYIEGLSRRHGHRFEVISFEKPGAYAVKSERAATRLRLMSGDITWHPLRYHKRLSPFATTFDVLAGRQRIRAMIKQAPFDLVHCRSYVATLIARPIARRSGIPYVFDMRGLWVDERVDGGLWPTNGWLYRMGKRCERSFLRDAAAIVTLTRSSVRTVESLATSAGSRASIDVIPTAVELDLFTPAMSDARRGAPVLGYFGSVGPWYPLDAVLKVCRECGRRWPDIRFRFLVNTNADFVRAEAAAHGLGDRVEVRSVPHRQVAVEMRGVAATICLAMPSLSAQARCLTKFGESLALGCPVIVNVGVGDLAEIVASNRIGVVIDDFSPAAIDAAVDQLGVVFDDSLVGNRCRSVAEREFALDSAVDNYNAVYQRVGSGSR